MGPQHLPTQPRTSHHHPPDHIHPRLLSPTNGDAAASPDPVSRSDAFKKDVMPKTPPMLIHKWIGFSPRNLSCTWWSGSIGAPKGENMAFAQSIPQPAAQIDSQRQRAGDRHRRRGDPACPGAPPWCLEAQPVHPDPTTMAEPNNCWRPATPPPQHDRSTAGAISNLL